MGKPARRPCEFLPQLYRSRSAGNRRKGPGNIDLTENNLPVRQPQSAVKKQLQGEAMSWLLGDSEEELADGGRYLDQSAPGLRYK